VITNPRLYAVVSRRAAAPAPATEEFRRRKLAEYKEIASAEASAERKAKHAVDRAAALLDRLEARSADLAKQIAALQKRKRLADTRAERIEDRVLRHLSKARLDRIDGFSRGFKTRLAPAALSVTDESLIPATYVRESVVTAVDKVAVKAALARGEEISGVALTQKVSLLRA
jgi:Siphovirus Gp157